jgi:hypothetical protein
MKNNRFKELLESSMGNVRPLLNEDNLQGGGTGSGGLSTGNYNRSKDIKVQLSYKFDNSNMKTGTDDINTNSDGYKKLVNQIRTLISDSRVKGPLTIKVTGGASSVGSSSGYNNQALSERRANKLINLLKKDIPNINQKINFDVKGVVGNATKLNSKEALEQQFVKVDFDYSEINELPMNIEIDNTAVNNVKQYPKLKGGGGTIIPSERIKVCYSVSSKYKKEFDRVISNFVIKYGKDSLKKIK